MRTRRKSASEFETFDYAAIERMPFRKMLSPPEGEVLITVPGQWTYNGVKHCSTLLITGWRPFRDRHNGVWTVNWDAAFPESLKGRDLDGVPTRILRYLVTVRFGGKTRRYDGVAVFPGVTGSEIPFLMDYVLGGDTVMQFAKADFETCFVRAPEGLAPQRRPAAEKIMDELRTSGECKQLEKVTQRCCDPADGTCGVWRPGQSLN